LLDGEKVARIKHLPPTITAKYNLRIQQVLLHISVLVVQHFLHGMNKKGGLTGKDDRQKDLWFCRSVGFNFQPADAKTGVFYLMFVMQIKPRS
jgi:outer membrane protein